MTTTQTTKSRSVLRAWVLLGLLLPSTPVAAAAHSVYTPARESSKPRLETLPFKVRWSISGALGVARTRLRRGPDCRALFTRLGADGLERLATMHLHAADADEELAVCNRRSAAAYTEMGSGRVTICPALFSELTREQAAVMLIHEALHHAGLGEWPGDPNGLTSKEITQLVRDSCGR